MNDHPRRTTTSRRLWQVAHVIATLVIPWVLAAYYMGSHTHTNPEAAHLVADFHTKAATAAAVLLVSSVLLRLSGRSVAASVPFAVMWVIALALSITQIREFGGTYYCEVELCMPDFGLFITAVPFAIVVSLAVLGSVVINGVARRIDL